jgi:hypothetical protein
VVDPNLDFADLDSVLDSLTGQSDNVTVRWTGQLTPAVTENYTFTLVGDNGFRLWIDDQLIIDHWVDDWDQPQTSAPVALSANQRHNLKVEYFEHVGGANLRLRWSSPSQPLQAIPNSALYLPPDFTYLGPLAATIPAAGDTATLTFDRKLRKPPASLTSHLRLLVSGTTWQVTAATLAKGDQTGLTLRLADPVPQQAGPGVRILYDGLGELSATDGTTLPRFNGYAINNSTYQITTPWAKDVSASNALPEYPRPQLTRPEWRNLNGTWQYQAGEPTATTPPSGDLREKILVPYPPESLLSGIRRHDDTMWYRRTLTIPSEWRIGRGNTGQRLLLHFGAVDYAATVWVNGTQVGTHTGGYDAFDLDITDAITRSGKQTLVVRAVDQTDTGPGNQVIGKQRAQPSSIWYTPSSGIWQTVWMEPVPAAHIDRIDAIPDLASDTLTLTVNASGVTNQRVAAAAFDGSKKIGQVTGAANTPLSLPVPNAKLWSPDRPFLYDLKINLVDDNRRGVDEVASYFGMRSVSVGPVNGQPRILLNGQFTFNLGTLDQGFWPDGLYTAPTDDALRYDLETQKRLGFNTVRKHIKVEPARWFYWADKLGLIVWQDMPSMRTNVPRTESDKAQFETELREMITEHLSHPSIAMWVPFNEGWGEYEPTRVTNLVKSLDPSRLVNTDSGQNCCDSLPDEGAGDIYDNHNYPNPGNPVIKDKRAIVDGEFGGLGLRIPGHMWFGGGFGYQMVDSKQQLTDGYVAFNKELEARLRCGLSGSIYTQPVDVEGEINGLMTYDRREWKVDPAQVRASNLSLLAAARNVTNPTPKPGTPGLVGVGSWPLDEVSGSTTPDTSAGGHPGTLVNAPAQADGHQGGALRFSGNQWVDTGASILDTSGDFSVSAWVNLDNPSGGFETLLSQDTANASSGFFLQYSGADHRFAFSTLSGRALAPSAPEAGRWYHLAGVHDAARAQLLLYVDGQLAGTVPYCSAATATGHTVMGRGQYQGNQVDFLHGMLDGVRTFDRALSAEEVTTLHASGS